MDKLTPQRRSANMARIRSKDTKPELLVRRLVHRMGYRFRLHQRNLPGRPDLVFPARKAAVLVHGCFWHRHPEPACRDAVMPKSRLDYWQPKLACNVERDAANIFALERAGWRVMVVWECETRDIADLEGRLRDFLGASRSVSPEHRDAPEAKT